MVAGGGGGEGERERVGPTKRMGKTTGFREGGTIVPRRRHGTAQRKKGHPLFVCPRKRAPRVVSLVAVVVNLDCEAATKDDARAAAILLQRERERESSVEKIRKDAGAIAVCVHILL